MGTYAIGDLQGCDQSFQSLLGRIDFRPGADRLWLVGDLVNRGPGSLEVLRWVRRNEEHLVTVLGNHDLHLLATAAGHRKVSRKDTLTGILEAPDRDDLLEWLRQRPLLHREGAHLMVHAGLLPQWTLEKATGLAQEVEGALRKKRGTKLLAALRGGGAKRWSNSLSGMERLATLVSVFTRLRTCSPDGVLLESFTGPPDEAPKGYKPWFELPSRRDPDTTVVFGHWAALGLHVAPGLLGLDTGCIWGGALTAVRLEDGAVFQEPSSLRC